MLAAVCSQDYTPNCSIVYFSVDRMVLPVIHADIDECL